MAGPGGSSPSVQRDLKQPARSDVVPTRERGRAWRFVQTETIQSYGVSARDTKGPANAQTRASRRLRHVCGSARAMEWLASGSGACANQSHLYSKMPSPSRAPSWPRRTNLPDACLHHAPTMYHATPSQRRRSAWFKPRHPMPDVSGGSGRRLQQRGRGPIKLRTREP